MNWLRKSRVTTRILALVLIFASLLLITLSLGMYRSKQGREQLEIMAHQNMPLVKQISEITKFQLEQAIAFQRAMRFGKFMLINDQANSSFFDAEARFTSLGRFVNKKLNEAIHFSKTNALKNQSQNSLDPTSLKYTLLQIKSLHTEYMNESEVIFNHLLDRDYAIAETKTQALEKKQDLLNKKLRYLLSNVINNTKIATDSVTKKQQRNEASVLLVTLFSALLAFALSIIVARSIIQPLNHGLQLARQIIAGKRQRLSYHNDADDEISEFLVGMNKMLMLVKQKEAELLDANKQLESRVAERTQELQQKNIELDLNNQELNKLNKIKNEFLGMAAHDLRNPLTVVMGYIDMIEKEMMGPCSDTQKEVLRKTKDKCHTMVSLLNSLLDVSAIESGNIALNIERVEHPESFLSECKEANEIIARQKNIHLNLSTLKTLPPVYFDRERMTQVLNNLVSNAIKYSHPQTEITLKAEADQESFRILVSDQGQGISEQEIKQLFDEYTCTSTKSTAGEKSTGLGLAIVKKIVEAHSGKIKVESELNKGSTFAVEIPLHHDNNEKNPVLN